MDQGFGNWGDSTDAWEQWSDPFAPKPIVRPRRAPAAVLGPPYGAWYNIPEIEILGMKFGTADALARATDTQIEKARKGVSLPRYNAETHQSRFYQAPTNNIGAYYRASYWLAVGARVLLGRGERKAAARLLQQARKDRAYLDLKMATAVPFSPDVGKEVPILRKAGTMAGAAGLPSIAKVLGVLPSKIEFAREARKQRGLEKALPDTILKSAQLKRLDTGERPWWVLPLVGAALLVTMGLLFRPYASAYTEAKGGEK
jgi:hypothetical protein